MALAYYAAALELSPPYPAASLLAELPPLGDDERERLLRAVAVRAYHLEARPPSEAAEACRLSFQALSDSLPAQRRLAWVDELTSVMLSYGAAEDAADARQFLLGEWLERSGLAAGEDAMRE
jgi:hypothetical protein